MCSLKLLLATALLLGFASSHAASSLHDQAQRTEPELLASTAPANAYKTVSSLKGRRLLNDDSLQDVVQALNSQVEAGKQAASEARKAAGKAADSFLSKLTGNPAAAAPITSIKEAKPFPAYAYAPAPAFGAALAPAAAITTMAAADTASTATAPAAEATSNATLVSTQVVSDIQLGAFLQEHAELIANTTGGNGSHVILATRLAQERLKNETQAWMAQQHHTGRKLQQTPGGDNLFEQVTENVKGFGENLGKEFLNRTYYMDQFDQLIHKLQDPIALQAGAQLFANNLCLFSTNLGALEASATGVSVSPSLVNIGSAGVNVAPQAMSISPALISVGATGVSVAPQGLNIAPALIAVTPGRVSVNPQGGTISPAGISVSASDKPAPKPAKPGQGRRLQQTIFEDIAHTVDNMKANAQAAAGQLQGNPSTSTTAAQPASTEGPVGSAGNKLPVASEGLGNWAALVGRMCQAANQDSTACLNEYFNRTSGMLDGLAGKYNGLKGSEVQGAVGHDFPKLDIKKPTFFSGSNDVVSSNVAAVQLGLTGISFSACAVPVSPVGVNVSPTGISVGPTVISISATGVNVQPQGVNISPNLIVVGPYDTSVSGQGLNIAPALIAVSPTKTVVNPVGPLKIADAKISKTLPALPGPDNDPQP